MPGNAAEAIDTMMKMIRSNVEFQPKRWAKPPITPASQRSLRERVNGRCSAMGTSSGFGDAQGLADHQRPGKSVDKHQRMQQPRSEADFAEQQVRADAAGARDRKSKRMNSSN